MIEREDFGRLRYRFSEWEPTIIPEETEEEDEPEEGLVNEEPVEIDDGIKVEDN